jgi:hypothetical protein
MARHLSEILSEAGVRGLFAGLGPRMIMTAGLVSSQFVMYGGIKEGEETILPLSTANLTDHASFGCPIWG